MTCPAQKPFEQLQAMTAFWGFVDVDISYNICLNHKAWFSYREHLELDHHQLLVKNLSAELQKYVRQKISGCGTEVVLCNVFLGHKENLSDIRRQEG